MSASKIIQGYARKLLTKNQGSGITTIPGAMQSEAKAGEIVAMLQQAEPEVVNWEGDIEMSGENVVNKVDDLITDTSKLQKYATDNKLTIKELSDSMKKQKYKNKLDSDPMEQVNYIENKSGMNAMDYIDEGTRVGDFDPKGYRNYDTKGMNLYDGIKTTKKADGGRIGFSGGGMGIFRAIIAKSAAKKGLSVTDFNAAKSSGDIYILTSGGNPL